MVIALPVLVAIAACEPVPLLSVPPPARRALVDYGGDPGVDGICVARDERGTFYRMRDSSSGVVVDVASDGRLLRRAWSGRW